LELQRGQESAVAIGLNAVIVGVTGNSPRVLTVEGAKHRLASLEELEALPFGPLDSSRGHTLEKNLRGWVSEQTGLNLGWVEQLYTFGDRDRGAIERRGAPRVLSVAYLALVRERDQPIAGRARWKDYYDFLPWEDWREGCPSIIEREIIPLLCNWADSATESSTQMSRHDRIAISFGRDEAKWDQEKVLERYELLYEAGLVSEARRELSNQTAAGSFQLDKRNEGTITLSVGMGRPMVLDHRRMLATALGRLRGKIKYRPVIFELMPSTFTLFALQRVVEALAGAPLHKPNFRRLVIKGGLVEKTGQFQGTTVESGRPAQLFRFRQEVLRERRTPGVSFSGG